MGFTGRSLPEIGRCCHCLESEGFSSADNQARHFGKVQGYIILGLEWQVAIAGEVVQGVVQGVVQQPSETASENGNELATADAKTSGKTGFCCISRGFAKWRGTPERIRTSDLRFRKPLLYPLSYRRKCAVFPMFLAVIDGLLPDPRKSRVTTFLTTRSRKRRNLGCQRWQPAWVRLPDHNVTRA